MKINRRTALAALAAATTVNLDSQTAKADNQQPKVQFYEVAQWFFVAAYSAEHAIDLATPVFEQLHHDGALDGDDFDTVDGRRVMYSKPHLLSHDDIVAPDWEDDGEKKSLAWFFEGDRQPGVVVLFDI